MAASVPSRWIVCMVHQPIPNGNCTGSLTRPASRTGGPAAVTTSPGRSWVMFGEVTSTPARTTKSLKFQEGEGFGFQVIFGFIGASQECSLHSKNDLIGTLWERGVSMALSCCEKSLYGDMDHRGMEPKRSVYSIPYGSPYGTNVPAQPAPYPGCQRADVFPLHRNQCTFNCA